jgi:hypothetical protein
MNTSQSIMNDPRRATDSEWYCLEARTSGSKSDVVAYSCILELRDRIKALEAATSAHPNYPENPGGSLVKRVANAMNGATERQARAVIREVAAWLPEQGYGGLAIRLEQEAKR